MDWFGIDTFGPGILGMYWYETVFDMRAGRILADVLLMY